MLRLTLVREFESDAVTVHWVPDGRKIVQSVEDAIEIAWRETLATPGVRLFDGPICRFEAARVGKGRLAVDVSRTSYRLFVGTNFCHPEFADTYGPEVMANGLGVSTGLVTADGFWVLGRRNASVAYYPKRVHPFAGSIEVTTRVDLFENARRELREELRLGDEHVAQTLLVGLAEDLTLRHPEAIFFARTTLSREQITARIDAAEHDGLVAIAATTVATTAALADPELTPIARAALLLGGRHLFGDAWFRPAAAAAGAALPIG